MEPLDPKPVCIFANLAHFYGNTEKGEKCLRQICPRLRTSTLRSYNDARQLLAIGRSPLVKLSKVELRTICDESYQ